MKPTVILLGSKPGAMVALRCLLKRGWSVKYVVANPNEADWLPSPTLYEEARTHNIPTVLKQSDLPSNIKSDFVISYMYRNLVTKQTREIGTKAALNFHAGPLPEFGGWAFYNIAILEDSPYYGCTCHYMDESFDTGPILKVNRFKINPKEETAFSLEAKSQREMIVLFNEFCELAESGDELPMIQQDVKHMRYIKKMEFMKLKEIPFGSDNETVDRIARAFWYPPYELAYMIINQTKIEIVPQIAKDQISSFIHRNDIKYLEEAIV